MAVTGNITLMAATFLQDSMVPIRNWIKIPRMTHMEEVADSMPLRCGCVISATYVRTCTYQTYSLYE
jgi:hypothetical protein